MAIRDWIFAKEPVEDVDLFGDEEPEGYRIVAGQSGDLFQWQDSHGKVLAGVGTTGRIFATSSTSYTHTFTPHSGWATTYGITPPRWEDREPVPTEPHEHPDTPIPCVKMHAAPVSSNQTNVPANFPVPITPTTPLSWLKTSIKTQHKPP